MADDEGQMLTNQEAATAWADARRAAHDAEQAARVRITPMARTTAMEAYHEACRQKFVLWAPTKFGGTQRGQVVLVRCPRKCGFGSIDLDMILAHFNTTGHYDHEADELEAEIVEPVFAGERPGHG